VKAAILSRHRIGNRRFKRFDPFPLAGSTHVTFGSNLIQPTGGISAFNSLIFIAMIASRGFGNDNLSL